MVVPHRDVAIDEPHQMSHFVSQTQLLLQSQRSAGKLALRVYEDNDDRFVRKGEGEGFENADARVELSTDEQDMKVSAGPVAIHHSSSSTELNQVFSLVQGRNLAEVDQVLLELESAVFKQGVELR